MGNLCAKERVQVVEEGIRLQPEELPRLLVLAAHPVPPPGIVGIPVEKPLVGCQPLHAPDLRLGTAVKSNKLIGDGMRQVPQPPDRAIENGPRPVDPRQNLLRGVSPVQVTQVGVDIQKLADDLDLATQGGRKPQGLVAALYRPE